MVTARCVHGWTKWQSCRECIPHDPNDVRDRMERGRLVHEAVERQGEQPELREHSDLCNIDPHYGTKGV